MRLAERLLVDELVALKHFRTVGEEVVLVLRVRAAFTQVEAFDFLRRGGSAFTDLLLSDQAKYPKGHKQGVSERGRRYVPNFIFKTAWGELLEMVVDEAINVSSDDILNFPEALHGKGIPLANRLDN